jgi:hypothetical protein
MRVSGLHRHQGSVDDDEVRGPTADEERRATDGTRE